MQYAQMCVCLYDVIVKYCTAYSVFCFCTYVRNIVCKYLSTYYVHKCSTYVCHI